MRNPPSGSGPAHVATVASSRNQSTEDLMTDSARIEADLLAALNADPRIPAPDEIAVKAIDGAVSLRGTVGSFAQRRAATSDAHNIAGVYDVGDELQVRLLDAYQREDAEIRGVALQMLMWDVE